MLVHLIGLAQETRREDAVRAARPRRAAQAHGCTASGNSRTAHRPGPASICSATDTIRCSTSAGPATCAHGCARTSAATASGRRSKRRCSRSTRIEWRVLGSELEAALEELRLIRELQPPANSRGRRKEHGVYLQRRGDEFVVSKKPGPLGPIGSRRQASLAARALASCTDAELDTLLQDGPLPRLRARLDASGREPALRGGCPAARSDRGARADRRAPAPAGAAAEARALPDRAGDRARLAEGVLRFRRRCACRPRSSLPARGAASRSKPASRSAAPARSSTRR